MKSGIIAFCGSKGSGKSTSASIFQDLFKEPIEELAFAGHLKTTCSKVFSIDMKYFIDPKLKEVELDSYITLTDKNIREVFKAFKIDPKSDYDKYVRPHVSQVFETPRSLLQYIGTDLLHPIDPLIHVKVTLINKDPDKLSIITDLRFLEEFKFMSNQDDFKGIYVSNNAAEAKAANDTHKSERELKFFSHLCERLDNNSDLLDLRKGIQSLIDTTYK